LHDFVKNENKTIVFSTHDLNISTSEVDKIWLMLDDKVVEGAPEDLILAGDFDQMFHSDKVYFNSDSGDFMLRKTPLGTYSLKGPEGRNFCWTGRALQRIGLVSDETNALVVVEVPESSEKQIWKVSIGATEYFECKSLYELTAEFGKRLKV
jgi:iron complex transport system ATP-binding protein